MNHEHDAGTDQVGTDVETPIISVERVAFFGSVVPPERWGSTIQLNPENSRPLRTDSIPPLRDVRSYKLRSGRVTRAQEEALRLHWDSFVLNPTAVLELATIFQAGQKVIVEIGTGMGEATAEMAEADPDLGILAIEVHRPGIGALLGKIADHQLKNVRIIDGDAVTVFEEYLGPDSLDGIRVYFPDPWPKKRHHKRRLLQSEWIELALTRLKNGGTLHIATDWEPYADWIRERGEANSKISGGLVTRPEWRALTRFERQGLAKGHRVFDFLYTKNPGARAEL